MDVDLSFRVFQFMLMDRLFVFRHQSVPTIQDMLIELTLLQNRLN